MADSLTEAQYFTVFWGMAAEKSEEAARYMQHITPEMFEDEQVAAGYKHLLERHAAGDDIEDFTTQSRLKEIFGEAYDSLWQDHLCGGRHLKAYAKKILLNHRARTQARVLSRFAVEAEEMAKSGTGSARKLADRAITALVNIHLGEGSTDRPQSRQEYTDHELASVDAKEKVGIDIPYQKLRDQIGPLIPGDLVGISGYSNSGKSTFLSNLWRGWALDGHPMIVFPTEMRQAWLRRGYAAHSRVPQVIAERQQWATATDDQKIAYRMAVRELGMAPWEVVNQPRISPQEIIARATVLRRKQGFTGKPVIIMVDHMHRLDYGGTEADFAVGDATQRLRDWAGEDQEGGIILVLLYQPRKPSDEIELYKPVMGHQIRGKSSVWNELDIHLSPYRRWVKCDTTGLNRTPWGSPSALWTSKGAPDFCAPGTEGGKLDDQHVYVKVDKRRVGGEGPTVMLDIDSPCGYTYERLETAAQVGRNLRAI